MATLRITGEFTKLRSFQHKLESAHRVLPSLSLQFSQTSMRKLQKGFRDKKSPDGQAWAPRKRKARGSLMVKSRKLKRSYRITELSPRGFTILNTAPHAKFVHEGTRRIKTARPILPLKDLPDDWRTAYRRRVTTAFRIHFKGAGKKGKGGSK